MSSDREDGNDDRNAGNYLAALDTSWVWNALGMLSIPLLVVLNGLFVAAEFALVAVRKTRVEEMVRQSQQGAKSVEDATTHLDRSIAAIQLGITLASIALGWVGEPALARLLQPLFRFVPDTWGTVATHSVAVGLAFLSITFLHVVFGELIPKTTALQSPYGTAVWIAGPLVLFAKLTRPLIALMDVLEEIVGDIEDEHDQASPRWYSGTNSFALSREPPVHPSGTERSPGDRTKIRCHNSQVGSDV